MNSVLIQYPAESLASTLGMDDVRFTEEVRMAAAMKLFDQGRLSSGQAARLAGVGRVKFLLSCGDWGVSSFGPWDEDDIRQEFSTALPEPVTQPS
jgi:predicted HTH domain antitoxin